MKLLRSAWLLATLFGVSQAVFAIGATKEDAQGLVKAAVEAYKTGGKEKLVTAVNTPKGPFDKGETYVYIHSMSGVLLAHPTKPEFIGKNAYDVPDPTGKLFMKEMIDNAKKGKSGWVEYMSKNMSNGKVEPKATYYEPVGDLVVAAGIYK